MRPGIAEAPRKRLVSGAEAAAYLGVNQMTVRRMIIRGEITGPRLGARLSRVDLNEIDGRLRAILASGGAR